MISMPKMFFTSFLIFMFSFCTKLYAQQNMVTTSVETTTNRKKLALAFSFPHILTLERRFDVDEESFFEAFVGGLPISSLLLLDTKLNEAGFSDTHKIAYSLNAWTFSSGLRYGRRLSPTWSLLGELSLFYVHGGAELHLKNVDTGMKIPFMGVGVSLAQPIFGLALRHEWQSWAMTLTMDVVLGSSFGIHKSGWFPSFQEVAPEYKDAVDDGSAAAESALSSSVNHLKAKFNIFPGLALSYRF